MKNKKILLILLGCLVLILLLMLGLKCYYKDNTKLGDNNKETLLYYNKNENFLKTQEVDGLKFKNISCVYDGNVSNISYEIENITDHEITFVGYDLTILDKKGYSLSNVNFRIPKTLAPGEVSAVSNEVSEDISKADAMNFKIIWEEGVENEIQ